MHGNNLCDTNTLHRGGHVVQEEVSS
jgi:hypothetical protein